MLGKIGISASGAQAGRVYAIVEHENGALFISDDYGDTWRRGSEDRNLRTRAWYYHHIYADPNDADVVWILNVTLWQLDRRRQDVRERPRPARRHARLLDRPARTRNRIILGDDGGAEVRFTGGASWSTIFNQPTAEFYHVTVDNREPYRVYGAQQDNTTMSVPSRSNTGLISTSEWYVIGGGESGYIAVKPDDPDIVFAGSYGGLLTRYDAKSRLAKSITVWPEMMLGSAASEMKYRFQWTSPTVFSPHDPNVLYHGGNHVFRTTNEGHSWERISPRPDARRRGDDGSPPAGRSRRTTPAPRPTRRSSPSPNRRSSRG